MKVFVYGTLRSGERAHGMLEGARYLGTVKLETGSLYTGDWYPMYVINGNTGVVGEVYEVSQDMIDRMDSYEGHPNLFKRHLIDSPKGEVFIYVYQRDTSGLIRIEHGDWVRDYGRKVG